jgi:hypothetical protein
MPRFTGGWRQSGAVSEKIGKKIGKSDSQLPNLVYNCCMLRAAQIGNSKARRS